MKWSDLIVKIGHLEIIITDDGKNDIESSNCTGLVKDYFSEWEYGNKRTKTNVRKSARLLHDYLHT